MSTVVCHGLESSSSHQLVETETLIRLKLAFPKKTFSSSSSSSSSAPPPPIKEINGGGGGCWSFLHALSNTSTTNYSQSSTSYVHPKAKPKSKLSDKSLELCTESLGSETGSHNTLDDVFSTTPSSDDDDGSKVEESTREKQGMGFSSSSSFSSSRKIIVNENNSNACKSFPPPLTTSSLRFRPHREGGRLIIAAVEGPPSPRACLRAERSHGRLRLALWRDCEESIGDGDVDGFENGGSYSEENEEEEEEKEEEEEEEEEEFGEDEGEESNVYGREDVDGNSLDVGVEMGMEALQRPSRCKEGGHGNKGLCNWEPFLVAT